ncbi:MAG: hypothetical protein HC913_10835 [Microscillaceae bacterium]|nr:hypothetical protein [Microscillaceae bacterium]
MLDASEPLLTFVSPLTGLSPDTFFYVRAYAIDSQNQVSYGKELAFRTVP